MERLRRKTTFRDLSITGIWENPCKSMQKKDKVCQKTSNNKLEEEKEKENC